MGEATVWAQSLGEAWERVGADRVRGVWPEALRATANDWGSDTASFLVRRDPGAVFPDLLPFTPVDIEAGGERCWSGFVWEPPQQADERAIAVECRGWQYHTDDDLLDRLYVHSRIEEWQDARAMFGVDLGGRFRESGEVVAGDGVMVLGYGDGAEVANNQFAGAILDLGPSGAAKRVVVDFANVGVAASTYTLDVRGADSPAGFGAGGGGEETIIQADPASASSPVAATFTTPRRYVLIALRRSAAATTETGDRRVQVSRAMVVRDTAYESGNQSILDGEDIAKDLLPFCPLLDQRTDLIVTGGVAIPDFVLEDQTPRQALEQANAVDGMQLRVTLERLLERRARPSVPLLKTGAWAPGALSGASRGSGEPIHNRVVVKGNDSSGGRVYVERYAGQQAGVPGELLPAFSNPDFEVNASGWTASSSTITRDTSYAHSGTAGGLWDSGTILNPGDALETTLSGTFVKGTVYRVSFWVRTIAGSFPKPSQPFACTAFFGAATDRAWTYIPSLTHAVWSLVQLIWVPKATVGSGVKMSFLLTALDSQVSLAFDDFAAEVVRPTLPDRRGLIRTRGVRIERPTGFGVATTLADASLRDAMRTPFKGDLTALPTVVRTFVGDAPVHPAQLLRHTGELLHHSQLVDPDTGSLGRDSRIVQVAYDDDAVASSVALDNTRTDFETQLARYEVTGR